MNFNNVQTQITKEEILKMISEYDIFKRYINSFNDINKPFCSELRSDKNPGCYIYITKLNELRYKDFANGDHLDCWQYVMSKFNCNYYEALNIIACDFGLRNNIKIDIHPSILIDVDSKKPIVYQKQKSIITIQPQPFNLTDFEYWNQYEINFEDLELFNVFSCKYVFLNKGDKRFVFESSKKEPLYAYRFCEEGEYYYKIYNPLTLDKKKKWLFNGVSKNIEGHDQLPLTGDVLILTKSMKDVICYYKLGIPAISLQGEANKLDEETVHKLSKRFNKIIVNYDEDETGISTSIKFKNQYGFDYFFIDDYKDLSDYVKKYDLQLAKLMINNKLNNVSR